MQCLGGCDLGQDLGNCTDEIETEDLYSKGVIRFYCMKSVVRSIILSIAIVLWR